jgi:hypothetical protein
MIFKRLKIWLSALLGKRPQNQKQNSPPLLPSRKPHLAQLRPGRQHAQIHDPDYLEQILKAEQEPSASAQSTPPTNPSS